MRPISNDLRRRIIETIQENEETQPEVAERFSVALSTVEKLWHRFRTTGSYEPQPHAGGRARLLKSDEELLRGAVKAPPDITLAELSAKVAFQKNQPPVALSTFSEELAELLALAAVGLIELYFGDESGFWQNPVIAKAWQFAGEEIRLFPEKGKRLAVFGFLNLNCQGQFWTTEKTIKSEFVIECLEQWIKEKDEKPTVLVLDNAKIHRSRLVQEKLVEWEEKGFYIFNLPPYSPHLNIIEILWRKMKYEWLKPEDYLSFESLTRAIQEILSNLGAEYKINFQDRVFIK